MKNREFGGNILASGQAVDHTHKSRSSPSAGELHIRTWLVLFVSLSGDRFPGGRDGMPGAVDAVVVPRTSVPGGHGDQVPPGGFAVRVHLSLTSRRGHSHHQPALGEPVGCNAGAGSAFHSEGQHQRLEGLQVFHPGRRGDSAGRYGGGRPSSRRSRPRLSPFCPARASRGRGVVPAKDEGDG